MRGEWFVISNLTIVAGYLFVAAVVAPRVTIRLWYTRIGAIGFFVLCGLHHLENVMHYIYRGQSTIESVFRSNHMLLIDIPQAVFVWMFVIGLYIEIVRWGPWAATREGEDSE